jgi:hypothetical protein
LKQATETQSAFDQLIIEDIEAASGMLLQDLCLLREKGGVYVYRCTYGGAPAIVKYFDKEDDRREILSYQMLIKSGIPTMKILVFGKVSFVMEDINASYFWRLGTPDDMQDAEVAECLARWYFALHEIGSEVSNLNDLYCEWDSITEESLEALCMKFPEAADTLGFILARVEELREILDSLSYTLTYNDFYWTNFIVRKDKRAALMFDYNLLGRGCRHADFSNIASLSPDAYRAFTEEYERLYILKHGRKRTAEEEKERMTDCVAGNLFVLISAFEKERFPDWAMEARNRTLDGTLLDDARKLLAL